MHNPNHLILCLMITMSLWGCPDEDTTESMGGTPMAGTPVGGTPMGGTPMGGTPMGGTPMGGTSTGLLSGEEQSQLESLVSKVCQAQLSCAETFGSSPISQEACERKLQADVLGDLYLAHTIMAEEEGRVAYNFSAVSCLLDEINQQLEQGVDCDTLFNGPGPDCPEIIEGLVADGQACTYGMECSDNSSCNVEDECTSVVGVCERDEGECTTDQECVDFYGPTATCDDSFCNVRAAREGESCEQINCEPNLVCDERFICISQSPLMEGEVCFDEPGRCATGLLCPVSEGGVCQQPSQQGEACTLSEYSLSLSTCDQGLYCEGLRAERNSMGICQPIPALGMACGDSLPRQFDGGYCGFYRGCVNNVCVQPKFVGEACSDDAECYSLSCDNGACSYFDLSFCE